MFYYDVYYEDGRTLNTSALAKIVAKAKELNEAGLQFERIEVSKEEALTIFNLNKFKIESINEMPSDKVITRSIAMKPLVKQTSGRCSSCMAILIYLLFKSKKQ
jgi:threonyl-tRNA synthetase